MISEKSQKNFNWKTSKLANDSKKTSTKIEILKEKFNLLLVTRKSTITVNKVIKN